MRILSNRTTLFLAIGLSLSTHSFATTYESISSEITYDTISPNITWWNEHANNDGFSEALVELGTSIDELNKNSQNTTARSNNVNDPLFWLKRNSEIYPVENENVYNIPITETHSQGRDRTGAHGRNNYFLTREYVTKGQSVKLMVGDMPSGVWCTVATGVGFDKGDHMLDPQSLPKSTVTTYQVKQNGTILIGCSDGNIKMPNVDKAVNIEILEGGGQTALLYSGTKYTG